LQAQFNTSYLFISHDLSNARYLVSKAEGRIGIMYLGELVEIGTVEQIFENPQHPYTKVLLWATPDLNADDTVEEPPVREIDIPDPANPPRGCHFHNRCPEARETCQQGTVPEFSIDDDHRARCYRIEDEHEYWDGPPLDAAATTDDQRTPRTDE
jgi:peptide/nickel transport system ATP-binding protein